MDTFRIGDYETGDIGVEELKAAAEDPNRVRCVAELPPTHSITLKEDLTREEHQRFNSFIDEMFNQLAKPYTNESNETIYIRADRATVQNIARCYAKANLLDLNLARQTRGYFIEPENLLTITVPTGLPPKAAFKGEFSGTFASFHKASWEAVAKILVENCIRQASWSRNEQGIPNQYPCYGFFGYSCEINDPNDLPQWPIKICTSNLYKVGKGQLPSGLISTCKSPKLTRFGSGGNCQLQRMCAIQGIARRKEGPTAMNSNCASVSYVASTHQVWPGLFTKIPTAEPTTGPASSAANDTREPTSAATPTLPSTTEPNTSSTTHGPATTSHHHLRDRHQRHHAHTEEERRLQHIAQREHHREAYTGYNQN